jgi:hypothetical protein
MKQKTPLHQAIAEISKEIDKWESNNPSVVRGALLRCREICTELLPTEQQVIEDAHNKGREDIGVSEFGGSPEYRSGKHYFTSKFEQ